MTPAALRSAGGALVALAVIGWTWSFDQREQTSALRQSLDNATRQLTRLQLSDERVGSAPRRELPRSEPTIDVATLKSAAAGYGSDARNMATALSRTKALCVAAGLTDCRARRSSGAGSAGFAQALSSASAGGSAASAAASAAASTPLLTPYAVTLTATFVPRAMSDLLARLAASGVIYRIDRISVVQNLVELDLVYSHSSETRKGANGRAEADTSWRPSTAPERRVP